MLTKFDDKKDESEKSLPFKMPQIKTDKNILRKNQNVLFFLIYFLIIIIINSFIKGKKRNRCKEI